MKPGMKTVAKRPKLKLRSGGCSHAASLKALLVLLVATTLVAAPGAHGEQAASKQHRLPAGFIDAGDGLTCAIVAGGATRCWGLGGYIGSGDNTTIGDTESPDSVGPVDLGPGRRALALSSDGHTCAILDNGRVRCWGYGGNGRLGYGDEEQIGDNETPASVGPVALGAGRRAVGIAAGGSHSCAILDTGRVRCWGFAGSGEIGSGDMEDIGDNELPTAVPPVDLGAGRRAHAITAGEEHTCALLDTRRVRCWGYGGAGRLGYGDTTTIGDTEVPGSVGPVELGRPAVAIAAGGEHTCAILDNGSVHCWGEAEAGQLGYANMNDIGDGETPATAGAVDLGAGRRAVAISAGNRHSCAVLDDGTVLCWGEGDDGRLGYGNVTDIGDNETPGSVAPVDLGAGAVAISAGSTHTCALLDDGRVRCWGAANVGQLGYGNMNPIGDTESPGTVGPVELGGLLVRKIRPSLSLAVSPKRDRAAPFRFTATGKLTGFLADPATCAGKVVVKAKKGKKSAVKRPALKLGAGGCTYAAALKLTSAGRWKVTASFAGNGSLRSRLSAARAFAAG